MYVQVEYRERAAAAGRIPHNFLKRELRMSEREVIVCRFIGTYTTTVHTCILIIYLPLTYSKKNCNVLLTCKYIILCMWITHKSMSVHSHTCIYMGLPVILC